jgi:hypothetical protein
MRFALLLCLLVALSARASTPFGELPAPVSGAATLASLASDGDLKNEPSYAGYDKKGLAHIKYWYVLGQREILDLADAQAIYAIVKSSTTKTDRFPLCVITPRHYFTYTSEYGIVEVLLCFECRVAMFTINGWETTRALDPAAQPQLNAFLKRFEIPVPVSK